MRGSRLGSGVWQPRDARLLNRRPDIELQCRLDLLEAQYRYTLKKLQQRKDFLQREYGRVTLLKVCEPKATVHRNMREIAQFKSTGGGVLAPGQAATAVRLSSSKSLPDNAGGRPPDSELEPTPALQVVSSAAPSLSIRQLKDIAAIDSIAAREKARREQCAREELQRLRDGEMAGLHLRVKAFIDSMGHIGEAAYHGVPT